MTLPSGDLLERAAELRRKGLAFALATVVRSRRPTSAKPGDRAIVLADGSMVGWVGGSCAQTTVQREALRALAEGSPRLVRLSPEPRPVGKEEEEGVVSYPMTCHSGGTLEIYVEPFPPLPRLLVVGESPVAEALTSLAPALGFAVDAQPDPARYDPRESGAGPDTWTVIASMGNADELSTEAALAAGAAYVALVVSRKRAAAVMDYLRERGLEMAARDRLRAPAGLDIGAATGPEVALSILAEIVQARRRRAPGVPVAAAATAPRPALTSRDPVCDMEVDVATARWTSEYQGRTIYFCAPGCKRRFDREPASYVGNEGAVPNSGVPASVPPGALSS